MALGGPRPRSLLAMMALEPRRVISTGRLIDGIWEDGERGGSPATVQVHVSNLRKALPPGTVATVDPGYRLDLDEDAIDLHRALRLVREALEPARAETGALALLDDALTLFGGEPLADLLGVPFADAVRPWIEEHRATAVEARAEVALGLGRADEVISQVEVALGRLPYREHLWALLARAQYRAARQADALATCARARARLRDDLGVSPGAELDELERQILLHDDAALAAPTWRRHRVEGAARDLSLTVTAPAAKVGPRGVLVRDDGTRVVLGSTTRIGRDPRAQVVLDDSSVSRAHAEVRATIAGDLLVDLGSRNGTVVNGSAVRSHVLQPGDEVLIGGAMLRYAQAESPPATGPDS